MQTNKWNMSFMCSEKFSFEIGLNDWYEHHWYHKMDPGLLANRLLSNQHSYHLYWWCLWVRVAEGAEHKRVDCNEVLTIFHILPYGIQYWLRLRIIIEIYDERKTEGEWEWELKRERGREKRQPVPKWENWVRKARNLFGMLESSHRLSVWLCVRFVNCALKQSQHHSTLEQSQIRAHTHRASIQMQAELLCSTASSLLWCCCLLAPFTTAPMCACSFFTYDSPYIVYYKNTRESNRLYVRFSFFPNERSAVRFSVKWLWTSFALIYDWVVALVIEVKKICRALNRYHIHNKFSKKSCKIFVFIIFIFYIVWIYRTFANESKHKTLILVSFWKTHENLSIS